METEIDWGTSRGSTRRKQVIGAQAAAVAVLVLIVYLTLLAPEGPGPLSGIEAPGGEKRVQVHNPGDRGGGSNRDGSGGGGTRTSGPAGGTGSGAAISIAGPGVPGGSTPDDTGFVSTPSDDQYEDAVEDLLRKVGDPSPAGG